MREGIMAAVARGSVLQNDPKLTQLAEDEAMGVARKVVKCLLLNSLRR